MMKHTNPAMLHIGWASVLVSMGSSNAKQGFMSLTYVSFLASVWRWELGGCQKVSCGRMGVYQMRIAAGVCGPLWSVW